MDLTTLSALAFTLVLWASAFAGIRAGLEGYGPAHLALLRFLVASSTLVVYAALARVRPPRRADLGRIALLGFLGITVYHVALNYGELTVSAGAASLLIASGPIFTALLAVFFLGERLTPLGWAGIGLGFAGVALIALGRGADCASVRARSGSSSPLSPRASTSSSRSPCTGATRRSR